MPTTYIYVFKWFKVSKKTRKTSEVCKKSVLQNKTGGCYICPVRKPGISPKMIKDWKGPYIITEKFGDVLYKIQLSPRRKPKVVHYDKLKPYLGENKPLWFNSAN